MQDHSPPAGLSRRLSPRWLVVLLLLLLPLPLIADPGASPEDSEDRPASPFDEFQRGDEYDPSATISSGAMEPRDVVPRDGLAEDPPEEAVSLRFRFDSPTRYRVNNTSRMGFEDRPGFRQVYNSGLSIEYRPISQLQRDLFPQWPMEVELSEAPEVLGQPILVTISAFSASFDQPFPLQDTARTHQLLKDAAFSYRITDRGNVSDLRIHPPTSPLARSSIEEVVRLLAASHPLLPEDDVEPGDSWSHTISLEADDEGVIKTHEVELTYTFDKWSRCGLHFCAVIDVDQEMKAAGRMVQSNQETRSATAGTSTGSFLFDPQEGRIIRSRWDLDAQGNTKVLQRTPQEVAELVNTNFHLNVTTEVDLLDHDEQTYDIIPRGSD